MTKEELKQALATSTAVEALLTDGSKVVVKSLDEDGTVTYRLSKRGRPKWLTTKVEFVK